MAPTADFTRPMDQLRSYLASMRAMTWNGPPLRAIAPVLIGAVGPRMLALAGEDADGAITFFADPAHTAAARRTLGPEAILVVEQAMALDTRPAGATPGSVPAAVVSHAGMLMRNLTYRRHLKRMGYPADLASEGTGISALVAFGGGKALARRVREHLDAGADQVAVWNLDAAGDPFGWPTLAALVEHL